MKWYHDLYLSGKLKKKSGELIRQIEDGDYSCGIWIVTLAMNGKDLLDIRRVRSLARNGLPEQLPMIVALAETRKEALRLVERIVSDCLRATGDVDVRTYLEMN